VSRSFRLSASSSAAIDVVFCSCRFDQVGDLSVIYIAGGLADWLHYFGEGGFFGFSLEGEAFFDQFFGVCGGSDAEAFGFGSQVCHVLFC